MHKITALYHELYRIGKQITKRDRFGIYARVEPLCIEMLELTITAVFEPPQNKLAPLKTLRIKTHVLKQIVRILYEAHVIERPMYFARAENLEEISKMTNGWISYIETKTGRS